MTQGLFSLARLDWLIYSAWLGALVVLAIPNTKPGVMRVVALITALLGLAQATWALCEYKLVDPAAPNAFRQSFAQFELAVPWIETLGISYHLGADGISLPLLVLTGIIAVCGVLISWNVELRTKEFLAFFLGLIGAVYGVFLALDVFLLFAFYEIAIIPKYFVIAIWGSTRKEYAAMKLVLYSFVGSACVMLGILAVYVSAGAHSFDLFALHDAQLSESVQFLCFPLVFFGFAVLAGMWPFHTWAPTGHSAAPTAASMLLAGVVMKLGAYGCLRVAMFLLPLGMTAHGGLWQITVGVLATVGIVYGASVALVQRDFKFVIGYSSVSHMGFVLLGFATLTTVGINGAVLQMFSHGIVASLLFAVAGRMVYERSHTRDLDALATLDLARQMPFVCFAFVVGGLASMGLPGFSGFVAELQVLAGAAESFPLLAAAAGVGVVITVWYTLQTAHVAFFKTETEGFKVETEGTGASAEAHPTHAPDFAALTWPERTVAVLLMLCLLVVGLMPDLLLTMIDHSTRLMWPTLGGR